MELDRDGAERADRRLAEDEMAQLAILSDVLGDRPGLRAGDEPAARALVGAGSTLLALARERLGQVARPVRVVVFDKTAGRNWGVAWHQDRTIAVVARVDTTGYGPWSRKNGVVHVEPPFEVLAGMLTVRAHLDACDETNAPLIVAKGSHRVGKVAASQAAEFALGFEQAFCLAEAGEIWLYRTPILHTSRPAEAPRRRRVLQVDFTTAVLPDGLAWAMG